MKREQVRAIMPTLQAFVDGKEIEGRPKGFSNDFEGWRSVDEISGLDSIEYRIKPEPTYRPFKDAEECWQEMLKHQPFGWLKSKMNGRFSCIGEVYGSDEFETVYIALSTSESLSRSSDSMFEQYTFYDGTPFGIKEE